MAGRTPIVRSSHRITDHLLWPFVNKTVYKLQFCTLHSTHKRQVKFDMFGFVARCGHVFDFVRWYWSSLLRVFLKFYRGNKCQKFIAFSNVQSTEILIGFSHRWVEYLLLQSCISRLYRNAPCQTSSHSSSTIVCVGDTSLRQLQHCWGYCQHYVIIVSHFCRKKKKKKFIYATLNIRIAMKSNANSITSKWARVTS